LLALACCFFGCSDGNGSRIAPAWDQTLAPVSSLQLGHNAVWSRGGLGLWDETSHAPATNVLPLVSDLRPGVLRFPGGTRAMRYHFDEAIGPLAQRKAQCDTFTGALDATSYGLDEALALAAQLGAAVTLVAPWVDGTPEEAAALVAYVNAAPDSTVAIGVDANGKDWGTAGDWAKRRGDNGHAAPYGVRWLEIGNEEFLDLAAGPPSSCGRPSQFVQSERWVNGARVPTSAADFATQVLAYAAKVRAVDPAIRLGAPAYSPYDGTSDAASAIGDADRHAGRTQPWNATLVSTAASGFDFFVLHPYDFGVLDDDRLVLAERLRKTVKDLRALAPDKAIAITEFGFLFGGSTQIDAVMSADMVRVAVEERLELCLRHILIEDDPHGPFADSAAILGPDHTRTAPYQVMQRLAASLQATAVPIASTADPGLVMLATRDDAGATLGVVLIDRRPTALAPLRVTMTLMPGRFTGTATLVSAPTLESTGSDVTVEDRPITANGSLDLELPPNAVAVVRLVKG
jgi:hypothetical protein